MKEQIQIEHLNKYYGKRKVLHDINLTIEQGMFGLLGRNGAGKTTLMKTLATLLQKKSGSITICGIPVERAKEVRPLLGYLPQEFTMYPSMTVWEAMDYLGVLSGMDMESRKIRIEELLIQVNLDGDKDKKIRALSGGMKRRLGIAQALIHNPKVLIVDEPTAGLDPEERIRFRNLLCEVAEERIVILSTHIVGDIEATCEKIAILNEGQLLYNGTVNELLNRAINKVYTKVIAREELSAFKKHFTVVSMQSGEKGIQVRFLSEHPVEDGIVCEANIEDAYMLYLNSHDGKLQKIGGGM